MLIEERQKAEAKAVDFADPIVSGSSTEIQSAVISPPIVFGPQTAFLSPQ